MAAMLDATGCDMTELHRHRLVRLGAPGWANVLAGEWDAQARACLTHWAVHGLPLVVTRQRADAPAGRLALGLAAPSQWGRRRLVLEVALADVLRVDDFPLATALADHLPRSARADWLDLCAELAQLGVQARVYGSHGWQCLSGLRHVHAASDIDLRLSVDAAPMADAVVELLHRRSPLRGHRLDGEIAFPDGRDIAWREWLHGRDGRVDRLLVKRLGGVAMELVAQARAGAVQRVPEGNLDRAAERALKRWSVAGVERRQLRRV